VADVGAAQITMKRRIMERSAAEKRPLDTTSSWMLLMALRPHRECSVVTCAGKEGTPLLSRMRTAHGPLAASPEPHGWIFGYAMVRR